MSSSSSGDDDHGGGVGFLMALGACWLAFRGHKPEEIAARAADAAGRVTKLLDQLEAMGPQIVKRVMQCSAPEPCECLACFDQQRERERARKRESVS